MENVLIIKNNGKDKRIGDFDRQSFEKKQLNIITH